jgi:hypothetical protein
VFLGVFDTFDQNFEKLTTHSAVTNKYLVFESRHQGGSRGGPPERTGGESPHQQVEEGVRRVARVGQGQSTFEQASASPGLATRLQKRAEKSKLPRSCPNTSELDQNVTRSRM